MTTISGIKDLSDLIDHRSFYAWLVENGKSEQYIQRVLWAVSRANAFSDSKHYLYLNLYQVKSMREATKALFSLFRNEEFAKQEESAAAVLRSVGEDTYLPFVKYTLEKSKDQEDNYHSNATSVEADTQGGRHYQHKKTQGGWKNHDASGDRNKAKVNRKTRSNSHSYPQTLGNMTRESTGNKCKLKYISIGSTSLSNLAKNILQRNKIMNVEELLAINPKDLRSMKGAGGRVYLEIMEFIMNYEHLEDTDSSVNDKKDNLDLSISAGSQYENQCSNGAATTDYSIAINVIGEKMAAACIANTEYSRIVMETMKNYSGCLLRINEIRNCYALLPKYRQERNAYRYIDCFSGEAKKVQELQSLFLSPTSRIKDIDIEEVGNEDTFTLIKEFLKWCCFDLYDDVAFLASIFTRNKRKHMVIRRRADKKSAEDIAIELGITKQTVYNIENSVKEIFRLSQGEIKLLQKIVAEKDGDFIVSKDDIKQYCDEYCEELYYLLRQCEDGSYEYDNKHDVFLIGDKTKREQIWYDLERLIIKCFDELPKHFTKSQYSVHQTIVEQRGIPSTTFIQAMNHYYHIKGDMYYRNRITVRKAYEDILNKYYDDGIRIDDYNELNRFMSMVENEYGDRLNLPKDRKVVKIKIKNMCVLCETGCYKTEK